MCISVLRHASVEERPALGTCKLLIRGQLLALGPFGPLLRPLRLCGVPLFGRPFLDLSRRAGLGGGAGIVGSALGTDGEAGACAKAGPAPISPASKAARRLTRL